MSRFETELLTPTENFYTLKMMLKMGHLQMAEMAVSRESFRAITGSHRRGGFLHSRKCQRHTQKTHLTPVGWKI